MPRCGVDQQVVRRADIGDGFVQRECAPGDHRFAALGVDAVDIVAAQIDQQGDDVVRHAVLARIGRNTRHHHALRCEEARQALLVRLRVFAAVLPGGGKLGVAVHRHKATVFGKYERVEVQRFDAKRRARAGEHRVPEAELRQAGDCRGDPVQALGVPHIAVFVADVEAV